MKKNKPSIRIQTLVYPVPNGVHVDLTCTDAIRLDAVKRFLPSWISSFMLGSSLQHYSFTVPLSAFNDVLPYGRAPVYFVYDVLSMAQADSIVDRYCAY